MSRRNWLFWLSNGTITNQLTLRRYVTSVSGYGYDSRYVSHGKRLGAAINYVRQQTPSKLERYVSGFPRAIPSGAA